MQRSPQTPLAPAGKRAGPARCRGAGGRAGVGGWEGWACAVWNELHCFFWNEGASGHLQGWRRRKRTKWAPQHRAQGKGEGTHTGTCAVRASGGAHGRRQPRGPTYDHLWAGVAIAEAAAAPTPPL